MPPTSDAVVVLRVLASLLLASAAWFLFRAPSAIETAQVTPKHCLSGYTLGGFGSDTCYMYDSSGLIAGSGVNPIPAQTTPLTFTCTTVWDNWIAKAPYTTNGTTYADLTGTWNPDDKIYDDPYSIASASCVNADHGRVHLFWTLIVVAGLVIIGAEVVRRSQRSPMDCEADVSR